ncbi:DUF6282 family protein [Chloroflexota bacterium]
MIIDLHTHTKPQSEDSRLEPAELIRRAKQAGIDGVCFTEHDWFWDEAALTRLSQEHDFLVLPGVEIDVDEGHLVVFGGDRDSLTLEYNSNLRRTEYIRSVVDEAVGFIILAHPYRKQSNTDDDFYTAVKRFCKKPVFQLVDAIETLNGRCSVRANNFSQELSRRLNITGTGGSDAHFILDIPSCATRFEREIRNVEQLVTELKAGRFRAVNLRHSSWDCSHYTRQE